MAKGMYKNCRCAVLDETGHHKWFEVLSGVKQGCVMSGLLFRINIDWAMNRTMMNNRDGIRWKLISLTTTLDDLGFANDFSNSLIIHAALTQPEYLILVRWMGLEPPMKNELKTRPCLNTRV